MHQPAVHDLSNDVRKPGSDTVQMQGKDSHEELAVTFKPFGENIL